MIKKIAAFVAAASMLVCMCACSNATTTTDITPASGTTDAAGSTETTQAPVDTSAPAVSETAGQGVDETAALDAFTAILTDVSDNYQPATAGCSLSAAKLAGELLDWNAQYVLSAESITAAAKSFVEALDEEHASAFEQKLGDIYAAAESLLQDGAADTLSSAGYTPTSFPWSLDAVTALFTALYSGTGYTLPTE